MSEKSLEEVGDSIAEFSAAVIQWIKPQMVKMSQALEEISKLPSFKSLIAAVESVAEEKGVSTDELLSELGSARKLIGDFQSRYEWFKIKFEEELEKKEDGSNRLD